MSSCVSTPFCTWTEEAECPRCAADLMEDDAIFMNFAFVSSLTTDEDGFCICSRQGDAHVVTCQDCDALLALSRDSDDDLPKVTLCRSQADIEYLGLTNFAEKVRAQRYG